MDWSIIKRMDHYEVLVDGEFYCSADTATEAALELELLMDEEAETNEQTV